MILDQKLNRQLIGVYLIDGDVDGTKFAISSKPNWFRRMMVRLLLGWRWMDIKKLKVKQEELKSEKKLLLG